MSDQVATTTDVNVTDANGETQQQSRPDVATFYFRYRQTSHHEDYRVFHPLSLVSMADYRIHFGPYRYPLEASGGYTVVVVRNPQSGRYHIGVSRCSTTDRFERKKGRERALQYALLAQANDLKIAYPQPHGKYERGSLQVVLENVPMRFLLDDDTIRKVDLYTLP